MPDRKDPSSKFERLRKQAEELVQRPGFSSESPSDILELIHELRIHQAELEIQNEELKRAQQELSDLHHEFENLYEFAPCGYVTLNDKGIMTHVNLTGARLLGEARQALTSSGLTAFIASGWEGFYLEARQKAGEAGEKQSVELPLKRNEGAPLWVRADIEADRDAAGAVIRWRVVLMDITPKKAADAALMESEERFRELFENAPIAYQSLDGNGNVIVVNETWLSLCGYSRDEVIGRNISDFLHPDWRDQYRAGFVPFKTVVDILGPECVMRKKDGTDILVSFYGRIGRDKRGDFKRTHCVFYDLTAQRRAEEANKILEEQLRQAQKMESIGTLAGGIAHEFNNLLSIIMGNNELAMDDLPEWHRARENLEEIRIAGLRARDVVRQLLTFSRRDNARKTALDLGSVVRESMKLIRSSIPANIDIKQAISDDTAPVFGNATQINQVIINLCGNATDAILKTGGVIRIEVADETLDEEGARIHPALKPGRWVKLLVGDNGCGMDKGIRDRIFEPYFSTKEIGKGTGIGLAIVHGIVERHNGAVTVQSEPDKGTAITVYFPCFEGRVEQDTEEQTVLPRGNERILLVDDEPSIIRTGKQQLERLGYRVQGTTNPREALEMFKAGPDAFDLVITDMAMPGMAGDQLSSEILHIRPGMKVILCTGFSERISEEKAYELGICTFAMKPLDKTDFAHMIRKVLDEGAESGGTNA